MTYIKNLAVISLLLLINVNCSIFQIYDLKEFPENSRTIYLQNFANETMDADVNVELNRTLRDSIHSRNNYIIVNDPSKARFQLHGTLIVFRREGRMYDNYRNPARYMLAAKVLIRLRENSSNQLKEGAVFSQELSSTIDYSPSEGFKETEYEARARLFEQLSIKINRAIEREFLSKNQ